MEKAYREFGHDIGADDTPLEAGLAFAVAWEKTSDFIGRDALLRQREEGDLRKRLVQFVLRDPEPLLYHNEPIWLDGKLLGYTTSAMYGHTLGGAVALGYVHTADPMPAGFYEESPFEIEVAGHRVPAKGSLRPLYDPASTRIRC
jgi:4-methylaminobutanoate oxidase (formaldehyde-forming)